LAISALRSSRINTPNGRSNQRPDLVHPQGRTPFPAAETNPLSSFDAHDLHVAIMALSPGQRQAVTLLKLQEKSLKEAASVSGMSVGALKVATHRGIAALKTLLHQRGAKE
jgi:RNA polymerase sigma-70 factor (ECF subfamily)